MADSKQTFAPTIVENASYNVGTSIDGHNSIVRGFKAARDPEDIADRKADDEARIEGIKAYQRAKRAERRAS